MMAPFPHPHSCPSLGPPPRRVFLYECSLAPLLPMCDLGDVFVVGSHVLVLPSCDLEGAAEFLVS